MPKKTKKSYSKDPNKWMNFLFKKGIKVYPEMIKGTKKFKIAIDNNGKISTGNKTYTTETINEGLFTALEFTYNKLNK